jgi:hypothetical protein
MTLVEVLISFFILFVVTLAVLELFSLSIAVNLGSAARTEMSYKAQLVAETVRTQNFFALQTFAGRNATCVPLVNGTVALPQSGCETFWGPDGVNAWRADAPYALEYQITTAGGFRHVTVTAYPMTTGATRYPGAGIPNKAVRYVAQL